MRDRAQRNAAAEDYLRRHGASNDEDEEYISRKNMQEGSGGVRECLSNARRARTKERASRSYFKYYEENKPAEAASSGSRAAVYKGEMGTVHRKSSRMQSDVSRTSNGAKAYARKTRERSSRRVHPAFVAVACVVFVLFGAIYLYAPAQQLYTDIREKDRLTAEYNAVVQRNEHISRQVQALQTDAGVEDMAREEFGWVREGEHAVNVSGLDESHESTFQSNIVSDDVPYPQTWYSGVLDPFFGIEQ